MPLIKFRLDIAPPGGQAFVNIRRTVQDGDWEIVWPGQDVFVELPENKAFTAVIEVSAPKGTAFTLYQDDEDIYSGETGEDNEYSDRTTVFS